MLNAMADGSAIVDGELVGSGVVDLEASAGIRGPIDLRRQLVAGIDSAAAGDHRAARIRR
jgi:hypothetical protein